MEFESRMYELETLLEDILDQFEPDPQYGYSMSDGTLVDEELSDLLDKANDMLYGRGDIDDE